MLLPSYFLDINTHQDHTAILWATKRQRFAREGDRPLCPIKMSCFLSKLGEIRTNFEVKLTKSARIVEIDHSEPGETALHLISSANNL